MPRHVAIIMDGNGRWAKRRGMQRVKGHEAGAENVREIVTRCARLGVEALTLYSFSTENWNRPLDEIAHLMRLYVHYLIRERTEIMDNDIRLIQVGRRDGLPQEVLRELDETAAVSRNNQGMKLCLALNYSSRVEIVDAVRHIAERVKTGEIQPGDINEQLISDSLYTADVPDPDLLVRTAGEMRVSNFLLWQISYAEIYVTDTLWPDFHVTDLNERSFLKNVSGFRSPRDDAPVQAWGVVFGGRHLSIQAADGRRASSSSAVDSGGASLPAQVMIWRETTVAKHWNRVFPVLCGGSGRPPL
ncbi:MAG: di-trans,poly-cis-decaprenylcistransferase [Planctomycetes bacterium]|nr:di-trans,poly-cis-decaprenylcistransferase [Planctomycetota bacterium]